jgi:hypothetical protein
VSRVRDDETIRAAARINGGRRKRDGANGGAEAKIGSRFDTLLAIPL